MFARMVSLALMLTILKLLGPLSSWDWSLVLAPIWAPILSEIYAALLDKLKDLID